MKTTVVNIRRERFDVYIGRGSPFGNPMRVGEMIDSKPEPVTRDEAIAWYRQYFHEKLKVNPGFKELVLDLRGKRLGCFCKPFPCHGDVIVEYLDKEAEMGMVDMTGQPRSDEELRQAIDACKQIVVKHSLTLPLFTVHAGIIINCLEELQGLRKLLAEARRKRLSGT